MPEYPDLRNRKRIAVDTETKDPGLKKTGPGWATGNGYVVGFSVAVEGFAEYFPVSSTSLAWLQEQVDGIKTKIFHNAQYDLGWLKHHHVHITGDIHDTMLMAPLLDEHKFSYSLDSLGEEYLGDRKDYTELVRVAGLLGIKERDVMANIWRLPYESVRPYAIQDAKLTLKLYDHLAPLIVEDGLQQIYDIERGLVSMLVDMRMLGVRVDPVRAEQVAAKMKIEEVEAQRQLDYAAGEKINVNASASIERVYKKHGIPYPKTKKGNPSFTKDWLNQSTDKIAPLIVAVREVSKIRSGFVEGVILRYGKNGRIHCSLHQLRGDDFGTISGRMSSSNPNLHQIPARHPILGPLVRGLFLPEDGCRWGTFDYSQQEPRLTVHYAHRLGLDGSKTAVEYYRNDPNADYHTMVAGLIWPNYLEMAKEEQKNKRRVAKDTNLGLSYGMGKKKLAKKLNISLADATELLNKYHDRVPFVRGLSNRCMRVANACGEIKTLLNRKCRFVMWEPAEFEHDEKFLRYDQAVETWEKEGRPIRRAGTFRALNRLIQGSAADQTKAAMLEMYKAGHVPHFPVHDEVNESIADDSQAIEIKEIMEHVIELRVPTTVTMGLGASWAEAK